MKIKIQDNEILLDSETYTALLRYKRRLSKYPIRLSVRKGYVRFTYTNAGKRHIVPLHHIVLGKPVPGFVIDHINRNPLDNRRCNLRVVTHRENSWNRECTNTLIGTSWCTTSNLWEANIHVGGEKVRLGRFKCRLKAHESYLKALMLL